jgi:hypothetical protein
VPGDARVGRITLRGANRRIVGRLKVVRHIIALDCRACRSRRRSLNTHIIVPLR